jgi:hypothetical protein
VPPPPPVAPAADDPRMEVDHDREPHRRDPGDSPAAKKPLVPRSLEAPLSNAQ